MMALGLSLKKGSLYFLDLHTENDVLSGICFLKNPGQRRIVGGMGKQD